MKEKYKLFNDLNYWYQIQEALYFNKYTLWMDRFMNQMLSLEEYETIKDDKKKQFEITLDYLSKLLRNWELKMKTFEQYKKVHSQGKDWYVMSRIFPWKEWENKEIEEGIKFVREKWNSFEDSREREFWIMGSDVHTSREWVDVLIKGLE